jgi:ATP/maltotriose-dependent transcriptional regulator MalT
MRYIGIGGRRAAIEIAADDPCTAIQMLRASRDGLADLGEYGFRSSLTADLADALYHAGKPDEAERMAAEARAETAPEDTVNFIIIPSVLARIHADRADFETALRLAEDAIHTAYRTDHPHEHARAELARAHVLAASGRGDEARAAALRALACYELKGDHTSAARVTRWLASLAVASPSPSTA